MSDLSCAVRQYRHNNSDGFVIGYHKEITERVVANLEAEIQSLKQELAECQELLKERDGGDHDADCKVYKGRSCNCVHNSVAEYFNHPSPDITKGE